MIVSESIAPVLPFLLCHTVTDEIRINDYLYEESPERLIGYCRLLHSLVDRLTDELLNMRALGHPIVVWV